MSTQTLPDLTGFTGSERYYRHGLNRRLLWTEGMQYLAEQCGAFWLIDVVASHQRNRKLRADYFQLWRIEAGEDGGAVITARHDSDRPAVVEQEIPFTDFPLTEPFEFYAIDQGDDERHVITLLKSEY